VNEANSTQPARFGRFAHKPLNIFFGSKHHGRGVFQPFLNILGMIDRL